MNLEQKVQIKELKNLKPTNILRRIQRAKVKSLKDMTSLAELVAGSLSQELDSRGYVVTADEVQYGSHPLYMIETNVIKPLKALSSDEDSYTSKSDDLGKWFQVLNGTLQYAQMRVTGNPSKLLDTQIAMVRPSTSYWYKVNRGKGKYSSTYYTTPQIPKSLINKEIARLKVPFYGSLAVSGVMIILIVNSLRKRG